MKCTECGHAVCPNCHKHVNDYHGVCGVKSQLGGSIICGCGNPFPLRESEAKK